MAAKLLTIGQAAEMLGRPVNTLYDWRYKGIGPKSAKIGGQIAYREADIDAYIEAQFAAADQANAS